MKRQTDPDVLLLQAAADPTRLAILRQLSDCGRGLRLRLHGVLRRQPADRLAPPQGAPRRRLDRRRAARHVDLVLAPARRRSPGSASSPARSARRRCPRPRRAASRSSRLAPRSHLTFERLEGLRCGHEDRGARIAGRRRSLGGPLVRAGRGPAGARADAQRLPRLRRRRPRPAAPRAVAPAPRPRAGGRGPTRAAVHRARRRRPRPRAAPRRAAPGDRAPARRPRSARRRAPGSRIDDRGRRPRHQEGPPHAGRPDPRPLRLHPQLGAEPDRRGAAPALWRRRLRGLLGRHRGDPGQPVRPQGASTTPGSTGAAPGASRSPSSWTSGSTT